MVAKYGNFVLEVHTSEFDFSHMREALRLGGFEFEVHARKGTKRVKGNRVATLRSARGAPDQGNRNGFEQEQVAENSGPASGNPRSRAALEVLQRVVGLREFTGKWAR